MAHSFPLRVYYEDTDLAGIVYYANYLKFIERARTEMVTAAGVDQGAVKAETGVVFAVARIEADYLRPAKFQDDLVVVTEVAKVTAARIVLDQRVMRGAEVLFAAIVTLVALNEQGKPVRLPAKLCRFGEAAIEQRKR